MKLFICGILNICGVFGLIVTGIAGFVCFIGAVGIFLLFTAHKFFPTISLVAGHPSYMEAMVMVAQFVGGGVVCFVGWHVSSCLINSSYDRYNPWQIIK